MSKQVFTVKHGDCLDVLRSMPDASVDSIVSDPPYGLAFMGKKWDYDVPSVDIWRECLRVLKAGGHLLAFGGTRTYHRMVVNIEDAGFEIRDQLQWLYGSGFPKSFDVGKAIDRAAGAVREVVGKDRNFGASKAEDGKNAFGDYAGQWEITAPATEEAKQWDGWGTALKPANEPICLARKPIKGTVAENVLKHGAGALNIDGCRVATEDVLSFGSREIGDGVKYGKCRPTTEGVQHDKGRWPANVIHDGSECVVNEFPDEGGSAARFFYCAKPSKAERDKGLEGFEARSRPTMGSGVGGQPNQNIENNRNIHPTVKPVDLMRWLCRLITPPSGVVLDPFTGSGTTGVSAMLEGFNFVGVEREAEYVEIARARIADAVPHPTLF